MAFPASLDTVKNNWLPGERPIGHAAHHNSMAILLYAIQQKIGVDGSAVTSSLDYKISALTSALASGLGLKANLAGGNAFTGNQTVNGTISADGVISTTGTFGISIATAGGSTPNAINIGSGGTYIGQINGDTFIGSAFVSKSFNLRDSSSVTQWSVDYGTGNMLGNGNASFGKGNTQNGSIVEANGSDHVYYTWLVGLARKAYMGFAAAGFQELVIANEFTNGNVNIKTVGTGKLKVNGIDVLLAGATISSGFANITSTTYTGTRLTAFTADGVNHTLTYEKGYLKSVSNGTNIWTMTYSNGKIITTVKT